MYRKYPICASSTHLFTDGSELPQKLITAIQVSTPQSLSNAYIYRITVNGSYLSVLIKENDTNLMLGNFYGQITQNQQTLLLTPLIPTVSGSITIGDASALAALSGTYYLTYANGRLEPSTVFCFTPPGVTALKYNDETATGYVSFSSTSINIVSVSPEINLAAKDPTIIASNNDVSATLGNCPTPLIKKINTVKPDSNGNIDIYGIIPIQISVGTGSVLKLDTVPELSFKELCPEKKKFYHQPITKIQHITPIYSKPQYPNGKHGTHPKYLWLI